MPKGVPSISKCNFIPTVPFQEECNLTGLDVTRFVLPKNASLKDLGDGNGGYLLGALGSTIVTVGGSLLELEEGELMEVPKTYFFNLKANRESQVYWFQKTNKEIPS